MSNILLNRISYIRYYQISITESHILKNIFKIRYTK